MVVFGVSVFIALGSLIWLFKRLNKNSSSILHLVQTGKPADFFLFYIFTIVCFAIIYWLAADINTLKGFKEYSWADAYYFSIITVTTLGYGDIYPVESMGKIIVCIQVVLGVITFGLFFSAVSRDHTEQVIQNENRIDNERKEELRKGLEKHVCLLMDIFQFGWGPGKDRQVMFTRPLKDLSQFMKNVHTGLEKGNLNDVWSTEDQVKHLTLLLEAADIQHPNLVSLTSIASEISYNHLITWSSLLTNISYLKGLHKEFNSAWQGRTVSQQLEILLNQSQVQIKELIEYSCFICNIKLDSSINPVSIKSKD